MTQLVGAPPLPGRPEDRWRRVRPALLAGGAVLSAAVALHLRDPHVRGSWGFCPLLLLTGASCPGCGGLRAVHDLTDGDLAAAASSNLLVVVALPVAALLWLRWVRAAWTGRRRPLPARAATALGLVALLAGLAFTVARNLPAGAWLAP